VTTCDLTRERLPEHVLGTSSDADERSIGRHLRGCAGCRREMLDLADGLGSFARATHDREPPPELRDRVRQVLQEEWRELDERHTDRRRPTWLVVAAAIAAVLLVAAVTVGAVQTRRAQVASEGAQSYETLLQTLGGKDFRVGELTTNGAQPLEGSVVVYDSHVDQSWVLVFVRTSGATGDMTATLHAPDGRTLDTWPVSIDRDGDGYGWLVTSVNLEPFDRITLTDPQGATVASGEIELA
jgi:Putative zinc-finger